VQSDDLHTFDIFDSSPNRPLNSYCGALGNDSVDQLVLDNGDINFSRKREHPLSNATSHGDDDETQPDSKRQRASKWPLKEHSGNEKRSTSISKPSSTSRRHHTPTRPSRFVEASMHDRPSEKPPSMFVRTFDSHLTSASVDHLMEDYETEVNKPLPHPPRDATPSRRSLSQSPDKRTQAMRLTHHPNASISHNATPLTGGDPKPSGGFFRFGKSMASSFNPLNLISKVATNWRATKEEMIQEAKDKKELEDRQRLAEETYAELKAAAQFGAQRTKPFVHDSRNNVSSHDSSEATNQRDSGIAMSFDSTRSSVESISKPPMLPPALGSPRKSSLHLRTPSLQSLRKVVSKVDLHVRSVSQSRAQSPDKEASYNELRRSQSKKDLQKQNKLSRRVSDLEAKLETARAELHFVIAAPSLPSTPNGLPRPIRQSGTWKRYAPALPTLLSERLLTTENLDEPEDWSAHEESKMFANVVANAEERPKTRSFSGDSLYQQPNEPFGNKYEFAPDSKSYETAKPIQEPPATKSENQSSHSQKRLNMNPTKSTAKKMKSSEDRSYRRVEESAGEGANYKASDNKFTKRKPKTERDSRDQSEIIPADGSDDEGARWMPGPESAVEDSTWEEAKGKTLKKKQKKFIADAGPKSQKTRPSFAEDDSDYETTARTKTLKKKRPSVTADSPKSSNDEPAPPLPVKKAKVLTKTKPLPKLPVLESVVLAQTGLETVHEESMTTSTVALKGDPTKPTARATPAHPGRLFMHSCSSSHPTSTVSSYENVSPPANITSDRKTTRKSREQIVVARPGESGVPPMPMTIEEVRKEEYEWDEDIF
jgi:hypothetical protein